jgi:hypothetical protein
MVAIIDTGEVHLSLAYEQGGTVIWTTADKPNLPLFAAKDPIIVRWYQEDQAINVVRSDPLRINRVSEINLNVKGELDVVFDDPKNHKESIVPMNAASRQILAMLIVVIATVFTVAAQTPSSVKDSPQMAEAKFDASRLRTGHFEYRMMQSGKQIGTSVLTIEKRSDGNFRFAAKFSDQEWESVATSSFVPISAALRIDRLERKQVYSMNLKYDGDRVTGSAGTTGENVTEDEKRSAMKTLSANVPVGTVDQRIDWAAMLGTRLQVGEKTNFTVYDPGTGVSAVAGEATKAEHIQVPVGTYETIRTVYRIEKSKGPETYEILASKETPRFLVREDFSDGMSIELVKMSE